MKMLGVYNRIADLRQAGRYREALAISFSRDAKYITDAEIIEAKAIDWLENNPDVQRPSSRYGDNVEWAKQFVN